MKEKFTKNIINQLFVLMRESENSEEIGTSFTIYKDIASVDVIEEDIIDTNWYGGVCEHEYAINFRDWTEEEYLIISKNNNIRFFGQVKGDINYYNRESGNWEFVENIYKMSINEA